MHSHSFVAFVASSAAIAVAAFGMSGCTDGASDRTLPSEVPPASTAVAAVPVAPLPAPDALTDVLSRLTDPAVPGSEKANLIESATPETAGNLDRFGNALRDGGYLPMTFTATDLAWSDKNPSNVVATVSVKTARSNTGAFTFPMEFVSSNGGWLLSRKTAEMLLSLRNSPGGTPTLPSPSPTPSPAQAPPPEAPSPTPSPTPSKAQAPPPEAPSPTPSPTPSEAPAPAPTPEPTEPPSPPG